MFLRQKGCSFIVTNICSVTMSWTELWLFLFVQMCLECLALSAWKGNVCCAWLTKSKAPTAARWPPAYFYSLCSTHLPKPLVSTFFFSLNLSASFSLCPSIHHPLYLPPHSLSLPSAQTYHTGSLFLANLSLIHYWDLFFFPWVSEWREGNGSFEYLMPPHEKCSISYFSTIQTGKLFAGHNTSSHEVMQENERKGD